MKLSCGKSFKVINNGEYNAYGSGPDFLNAKIEIDGILWVGNVELHVKSKDWYAHKHQFDRAYNNVVLHVVYENNGDVYIGNDKIPTLELLDVIQEEHFQKFELLLKNKKTILCGTQLNSVPEINIVSQQERSLIDRLNRKTNSLAESAGSTEPMQILYFLMARAMGAKLNQLPFEELTHRLPLKLLKSEKVKSQSDLILITSGLSRIENVMDLLEYKKILQREKQLINGLVAKQSWKFGGVRPGNSPTIRVEQFAQIIQNFDFEVSFIYLSSNELLNYLLNLLVINEKLYSTKIRTNQLSISFKHQIIINCFVPFIYWYGQKNENENLVEKAIELLRLLPAEQNSTIDKWIKNKIEPKNAAETQSLLEMINELCSKKKCLSCEIGIQLLNK
ncbi:MAG: hypothetical protein RI883_2206 [Bacteroidota bacterium]